jgi:hypothetical protein
MAAKPHAGSKRKRAARKAEALRRRREIYVALIKVLRGG